MSAPTRTSAYELMDGRYRLHYRTKDGGGSLHAAGEYDTLLQAQAEAARWEAAYPGMQVWIIRGGRFVDVEAMAMGAQEAPTK